jgi:DNA-binding CsgD family transcriptional regulator
LSIRRWIAFERREALALRLLRKIEALPLSRREKDLCLLLARDHDTASAARAMGVSESTVVTHRRSLYEKLGLESRTALINRLNSN